MSDTHQPEMRPFLFDLSRRYQIWIVLSVFTLLATICLKVWAKALLKNARSPLPVDVRRLARQPEVELKKRRFKKNVFS